MPNSKESETVTTDSPVTPTLDALFAKAFEALKEIAEKLPGKEKEFDPVEYLAKTLKEHDVLLEYRVVAYGKNGEIFNVSGVNNLPRLFDESMLPEAPLNFENAFNSSVIRPALNAFMKYTRDKAEEYKKVSLSLSQSLSLPISSDPEDFISG